QNWIGPGGSTLNNAVYVPPPPHEVPIKLSQLEKFIHSKSALPLLVEVGLVHAQFETIHPFLDGNGRVGRLLITFLLCQQEVLTKPVLYLSHYFKAHRQEYYERLQAVRDSGDWESWLRFFLRGVVQVSGEATNTARKIIAMRELHRLEITEKFGRAAGNGHRVLEYLYANPIVSVNDVQGRTGTTYPAANSLVGKLVDTGILKEFTGQARNRRFIYDPYIKLFYPED
ncbi:MAG: Fic family protein, partial [Planctomycetes bacterium]|nr:Fic family protein [Planctomycetota bacterium]